MNSKLNRQIRPKKSQNTPKAEQQILKGETSKIQSKLQSLKAEIAMRKTMKNKEKQHEPSSFKATLSNNTGQSWNAAGKALSLKPAPELSNEKVHKFLLGSSKQLQHSEELPKDKQNLYSLLQQLKMEQCREAIEKNGVHGLQKLLQLAQEEIDEWKNIPIGFRVKLRKFIAEHNRSREGSSPSCQHKGQGEDIEAIMERRKQERIYEPINDKPIEEEEEQWSPAQEQFGHEQERQLDEEDILISSLNSAFLQRKGIIKKEGSSSSINASQHKGRVQWNANVKQYNKETSTFAGQKYNTKYPKGVSMAQQKTGEDKGPSYCWECLKKVQKMNHENHRTFCSSGCREKYIGKTAPFLQDAGHQGNQKVPERKMDQQQGSGEDEVDLDLL